MFISFPCFYLLCWYHRSHFTSLIDYQRNVWLKSHLKESDPANSWGCENLDNVQNGRRFFFLLYFFSVLFMVVGSYRGSRIPDHCYQMPEPEWKQWRPRGLKNMWKALIIIRVEMKEIKKIIWCKINVRQKLQMRWIALCWKYYIGQAFPQNLSKCVLF